MKQKSYIGGGGKRINEYHKDGTSTSWDYNKYGRATRINDHEGGRSHSHNVIHYIWGPSKGSRRK